MGSDPSRRRPRPPDDDAALAGAAVVSDYSAPLEDLFGQGRSIRFFDRARAAAAGEEVAAMLESSHVADLAAQGGADVAGGGLWRDRAADIVRFIDRR